MGNITDLIKDVASKNQIIETFAAKVIEINNEIESFHNPEDAYTVNIMRADGAILKNVRLKASIQDLEQGIITIPKKDSWVLATIIDGVETRAFISQYSEVDRLMGRIQGTNEPKLLFDYSSDGELLQIRYVKTDLITETNETKIIDVAKIEFNKDRNFKVSYFDDDEKPLLKRKIDNVFTSGEDTVEAGFLLKSGKKTVAKTIVYEAFEIIKQKTNEERNKKNKKKR